MHNDSCPKKTGVTTKLMKFKDLISKYKWEDVKRNLSRLYPKQKENIKGYERVFDELQTLTPIETKMRIVLEGVVEEEDCHSVLWTCVSGKDGSLNKDSDPDFFEDDEGGNRETSFAVNLFDWAEWLDMGIDSETIIKYSDLDIISHCLYEMAYYGFTQEEVREQIGQFEQLLNSMKEDE